MCMLRMLHTALNLAALLVVCSALATAGTIDFTGLYAPSNWTLTNVDANGTVDTSGAPGVIALTGGNNSPEVLGSPGSTRWTIVAPPGGGGFVAFDWGYTTADVDGPSFDLAGWLLNGAPTQLSLNGGPISQSGSSGFLMSAGDTFGFYVNTTDNSLGAATLTVSNFSVSDSTVPEPGTWLLVGGALALAGLWRRRATQ